jgi:hypothetical protein
LFPFLNFRAAIKGSLLRMGGIFSWLLLAHRHSLFRETGWHPPVEEVTQKREQAKALEYEGKICRMRNGDERPMGANVGDENKSNSWFN